MPAAVVRVTPADIGLRVTLRRLLPSGSATDVVGDLTGWDDGVLTVRDRDDVPHRIAAAALVAGHVVLARPVPARVRLLERVAADGWPAVEREPLGGWLLRAAGGFTSRANSALAVGDPELAFAEAAARVRAWYEARGLPARAAVVLPSPEDDTFAALDWAPSPSVLVQAADLVDLPAAGGDDGVDVGDRPGEAWLARYTARGPVGAVGRRVLTGGGTVAFAQFGDPPIAIGRAVARDGWVGLSAIEVDPDARRGGLGRAVTLALLRWGADHGASRAYLQVQSDNAAARELYAAMGFRDHHRYRYRAAP